MMKNILCPLDGSGHANNALEMAIDMAQKFDAGLVLFHVLMRNLDPDEIRRFSEIEGLAEETVLEVKRIHTVDSRIEVGHMYNVKAISTDVLVELGQQILNSARAKVEEKGVSNITTALGDGDPAARILACANEQNIDCIVMGSRGLSDIQALLQGSVSRKVSNRANCTTITVR